LFIARTIVAAHGGDIQVSSAADAGTIFTVELPNRCSQHLRAALHIIQHHVPERVGWQPAK
jgi:K+-sensing histidine kinase KdpD